MVKVLLFQLMLHIEAEYFEIIPQSHSCYAVLSAPIALIWLCFRDQLRVFGFVLLRYTKQKSG